MNDRIQELVEQCGDWNGQTVEMNDIGIQVFVKSIVQECAEVALLEDRNAYDRILRYFGVES
jgi:hypothetical protein